MICNIPEFIFYFIFLFLLKDLIPETKMA